jgi:hypothetical protein
MLHWLSVQIFKHYAVRVSLALVIEDPSIAIY